MRAAGRRPSAHEHLAVPERAWSTPSVGAWVVWLTFGALSAVHGYVLASVGGVVPSPVYAPVVTGFVRAALWLLVTPWVAWAARRWPAGAGAPAAFLAPHLAAGLALSAADGALHAGAVALLPGAALPGGMATLVARLPASAVLYAGIVLVVRLRSADGTVRDREIWAARLERDLLESRMEVLNQEIAPHFLFHSLTLVSSLLERDTSRADEVLVHLSDMLRRSLAGSGEPTVSLAEELAALEPFVEIQRTGHDGLRVEYDVEPDARDALVPTLLLQPLAENAILHGIEPTHRSGTVAIRARVGRGRLELLVEDDGVGLDETHRSCFGIGLRNVRSRLAHLYGGDATLTLEKREGGGTRARILLPLAYRREEVLAGR